VKNLFGFNENLPGYPSDLIGQGNDDFISMHALLKLSDPCSQGMSLAITGLDA
jgi:hypothetical protein